ncbi:MAG: CocE/NonD family hydrolase [Acidimicrobiales bacterium]
MTQRSTTPGPRFKMRWLAVMVAFSLVGLACTDGVEGGAGRDSGPVAGGGAQGAGDDESGAGDGRPEPQLEPIELAARPGPFQLTIDALPDGVSPSATIEVHDESGALLTTTGFADSGSAVIRELPPGPVEVRLLDGEPAASDRADGAAVGFRAQPITIPGEAIDDPSIHRATALEPGFNYIPTRDGTTLSAFVSLPGSVDGGPYPVLVEYSGYSPSNPSADDDPYRLLIPALGYALVQVNVRGTGCSGGSFDAFERIQSLDGYDVIETIAAQAWSGNVGMFGVSYPGIMQLHVASTQPPSLAAIAPLSVTDGVDSVLYPGGIYNDGFGEEWTRRVGRRAQASGQSWSAELIAAGDETCAANQTLRVHNPDLVEIVQATPYVTELSRSRSAITYAPSISVPTLIGGAWQDEQTGGRFPALLPELTAAPVLRAVLYNGLHIDAVSGEMLTRLIEFFDLYVADRPPNIEPITRLLIGVGLSALFGESLDVPASDYGGLTAEEARSRYEAEPPIEILFEQGAESSNLPVPGFEAQFGQWPPAATEATSLYLSGSSADPALDFDPPEVELTAGFVTEPAEGQATTIDDLARVWTNNPGWNWPVSRAGAAVVATSEPLDKELVLVGNLSADLWVSIDDPDGDTADDDAVDSAGGPDDAEIEVTVSEVGPDGSETYVQAGWLRLSQRAPAEDATELRPLISGLESDRAPLRAGGEPVLARVEVLPFAHVFRAGSRLRVTVDTPGASRPQWRFAIDQRPVAITIHSSPERPSRLVVPAIPNFDVPTGRPACGSLRGQPCRQG